MEDNETSSTGGTPSEVSQSDATKSAFPAARQEQTKQGFNPRPDIDILADKMLQAHGTEGFSRAVMEFYEAKAAEIRQLPEDQWVNHGLGKYESVSTQIREQLGEPKLEVSYIDMPKTGYSPSSIKPREQP